MKKTIVNEDEMIKNCNEILTCHPLFKDGMEIIGVPEGGSGFELSGYSWKGPNVKMRTIVPQVIRQAKEKYQLKVTMNK